MTSEIAGIEHLPDITPQQPDAIVQGRAYALLEKQLGGYDYYLFSLIQKDGSEGLVKISKQTYDRAATRNFDGALKMSADDAVSLNAIIKFSRTANPKNASAPFWNVDKGDKNLENEIPLNPTKARPEPAKAQTSDNGNARASFTREEYMEAAAWVYDHPFTQRLIAEGNVAVQFNVNAVTMSILSGR